MRIHTENKLIASTSMGLLAYILICAPILSFLYYLGALSSIWIISGISLVFFSAFVGMFFLADTSDVHYTYHENKKDYKKEKELVKSIIKDSACLVGIAGVVFLSAIARSNRNKNRTRTVRFNSYTDHSR